MTAESTLTETERPQPKVIQTGGGSGDAVYGIGLIGAWIYFIGRATTTEDRIKGFFKGLVWPAYLVYRVFKFLDRE